MQRSHLRERLGQPVNLFLLCANNVLEAELAFGARLEVLRDNPVPVLVILNRRLLRVLADGLLKCVCCVRAVPYLEVDECDVERVAVGGLLGDEVDAVNFADQLTGELLGDELLGGGLVLLVVASHARKRARVHARNVEGHLLVELGRHDGCVFERLNAC